MQRVKNQKARQGTLALGFGFRLYANKSILKVLILVAFLFFTSEKCEGEDIEIFEPVAEDNNLDPKNGS